MVKNFPKLTTWTEPQIDLSELEFRPLAHLVTLKSVLRGFMESQTNLQSYHYKYYF